MNGPMRARLLAGALIAICLSLSLTALPAAAETTVKYTDESKQAYEQQLAKGEIASATFNKKLRSLHLTLKNGEHVLYHYPRKGSKPLEDALRAHHITVTVLTPTAASKEASTKKPAHKLRYIAGGIILVVLIVVGIVLLVNRRRQRD